MVAPREKARTVCSIPGHNPPGRSNEMKTETAAEWIAKIIRNDEERRNAHYRTTHAILGWNNDTNHVKTCTACNGGK